MFPLYRGSVVRGLNPEFQAFHTAALRYIAPFYNLTACAVCGGRSRVYTRRKAICHRARTQNARKGYLTWRLCAGKPPPSACYQIKQKAAKTTSAPLCGVFPSDCTATRCAPSAPRVACSLRPQAPGVDFDFWRRRLTLEVGDVPRLTDSKTPFFAQLTFMLTYSAVFVIMKIRAEKHGYDRATCGG